MARRNRILDLVLLLLQLHIVAATTCYNPDGTAVTDLRYKPCISIENEFSMCCRLNDTNPDQCYPNGLCYWPLKNQYWRNFCTDQTWESPNCIPNTTCPAASGAASNQTAQFILCTDGSYCCGTNNDCCTSDQEFSLKATLVAMNSNVTETATSVSTVTATITGKSKGDGNKTVAVGVGVGVSLGVLSVAMLGAGFFWGRRQAQAKYEALQQSVVEPRRSFIAQLPGSSAAHEASGSSAPETSTSRSTVVELPGDK